MSSKQNHILPLYLVHKQSYRLNERNIIIFLIGAAFVSLIVIYKYLPSNVVDNKQKGLNELKPNDILLLNNLTKNHETAFETEIKTKINIPKIKQENTDVLIKRDKVKDMTLLAWSSYRKYAWGYSELKPVSKTGHSPGIFGSNSMNLGATIVDSLDTLYIMGLTNEYNDAKDWIIKNLDLDINSELSVFEVNIRFVGGLLSMHSLTGEKIFLEKAEAIAQLLLPAFDSPTGLPFSLLNPKTKHKSNYGWASSSCSILAELGTLSLEFGYISDHTDKKVYQEKIDKIFQVLNKADKPEGLYYNYINPHNGQFCTKQATLGALADSFYEYLLKLWLYKDKKDKGLLDMYLKTMKAVEEKLIKKSQSGLTFVGETNEASYLVQKMGHLACFSGGLFALSSIYIDDLTQIERDNYKHLAIEITNTCHESYIRTATHLGPESFHFSGVDALALNENEKYYILRPEVVESYFYLWRMTKEQKYRDWAWDVVLALEKHCKTENGFQGLKNVYQTNTQKDDVQQSFFIAETLKYLYLIFSDDDILSLDKYVFNTEAHPFLIKKN